MRELDILFPVVGKLYADMICVIRSPAFIAIFPYSLRLVMFLPEFGYHLYVFFRAPYRDSGIENVICGGEKKSREKEIADKIWKK